MHQQQARSQLKSGTSDITIFARALSVPYATCNQKGWDYSIRKTDP
jgi:hypothetical protein